LTQRVQKLLLAALLFLNGQICPAANAVDKKESSTRKSSDVVVAVPKAVDLLWRKAKYSFRLEKFDQAIEDYGCAIKIDPKFSPLYQGRAEAYAIKEDYKHAVADYSAAIMLDAENKDLYRRRGNVYEHLAEYDKALADYNKELALGAIYFGDRARVYVQLHDYKRAVQDYTTELKHRPDPSGQARVFRNRAAAYDKLGMKDRADRDRKAADQAEDGSFGSDDKHQLPHQPD
jgi:tetratricopeptide (TPR) repeat protein